jgi:amino acid transporter
VDSALADPASTQRPLAAAAGVLLGPWGATLLTAGALLSVTGFLTANFLYGPRLTFAYATHADFPAFLGRVHPVFRTPHLSILTFGFLVWGLTLYGNFQWNATLSAVARLFVYAAVCASLIVLRRRDPAGAQLRVPGGPVLAVLGFGLCLLLIARMGRAELYVVLPVAAAALVTWIVVRRRSAQAPTP